MTDGGHDPFAVDEGKALGALTLAWGDLYEIYVVDGQWQAWRDDAPDEARITAPTPDGIDRCIREDWLRHQPP